MCGIFGVVTSNRKGLAQTILESLKLLEYRGYDSWGIAVAVQSQSEKSKSKFVIEKHTGKIGNSTLNHELSSINSPLGLGHTRWATHGGVTVENAHPHLDCRKNIALVHNGIVENFEELKKGLDNKHYFRSQTDTEVIVHLIEELAQNLPFAEGVRQAFLKLQGLNAIVTLSSSDQKIIAVKNGSPLVIGQGKVSNYIASDQVALTSLCNQIAYLPDNTLVEISLKIRSTNARTKTITKLEFTAPKIKSSDAKLDGFDHFMAKEIHEQPKVISQIAQKSDGEIKKAAAMIKHLPAGRQVYLVGAGSAFYAALIMEYLLSTVNNIPSLAVPASEFENVQNFLKKGDLVIAYSQSGETADLISALGAALQKGATIMSVVNVADSTIDRMSDHSIHLNAGPEIAVVSTKAFSAKIAVSLLICYSITKKIAQAKRIIKKLSKSLKIQLKDPKIKELAIKLKNQPNLFTIGRNIDYPIALEAALKLKETAYIHAEGFAAGELKHGVIALIEKGTPVLVFATIPKYRQQIISSAWELAARGAYIIGISTEKNSAFNYFLKVPEVGLAQIISAVVYAQYLAYLIAVKRGLDPDKPRNLAKSVTVK